MKKKDPIRFSVVLDEELDKALMKAIKMHKTSKAQIMRAALGYWLEDFMEKKK